MKRITIFVVACLTSIYSYAGIWGNVIGGATGGAIGRSAGKAIAKPDMERVIAVSVDALNKQTPMMVDDGIRLERRMPLVRTYFSHTSTPSSNSPYEMLINPSSMLLLLTGYGDSQSIGDVQVARQHCHV